MRRKIPLPLKALQEAFVYMPTTGILYNATAGDPGWKPDTIPLARLQVIGDGFLGLYFQGAHYFAHRVCWALYHGRDPGDAPIKFRDGDRKNLKLDNLYEGRNGTKRQEAQLCQGGEVAGNAGADRAPV